jgi:hypothetical protein
MSLNKQPLFMRKICFYEKYLLLWERFAYTCTSVYFWIHQNEMQDSWLPYHVLSSFRFLSKRRIRFRLNKIQRVSKTATTSIRWSESNTEYRSSQSTVFSGYIAHVSHILTYANRLVANSNYQALCSDSHQKNYASHDDIPSWND